MRRTTPPALALLLAACTAPAPDGVPEEAIRQNILGTAYLGQQKWTEAEGAFRAAALTSPRDPLPPTNVGVALIQQGKTDEAEVALRQAQALDPDYAYAHYNLGLIQKNRGDSEAAAVHFAAVAAQDPGDLLTWYNLGSVYSQIGRNDEARQAFEKALAMNPTHVSTLYGFGRFLLQQGEPERGAAMIQLSQEIRTRSGLDVAVGTQYGEQGPYAMGVDYPGDALAAPAPIDVRFTTHLTLGAAGSHVAFGRSASGKTLLLATEGASVVAVAPDGATTPTAEAPGTILGLAAADVDGDGEVDLIAVVEEAAGATVRLVRGVAGGGFRIEASPLDLFASVPTAAALTLVDTDHDGDLDLFLCTAGSDAGCRLGVNPGSGALAFRGGSEIDIALAPVSGPLSVGFSDVDNDRDVDLLALAPDGLHIYENMRDGSFPEAEFGLARETAGASAFAVADVNKDGFMDIALAGPGGIQLGWNRGKRFEVQALAGSADARGVVVLDHDNDGFLDVAAGGAGTPALWRNAGRGRIDAAAEAFANMPAGAVPVAAWDAEPDGDLDLVARAPDSGLLLLANDGGNARRWIAIESVGVGDNRLGIGSKVEVLAGALRQKFEIVDARPIHAGLGERDRVESVRHLWPGGVLQDETEQAAGTAVTITQLDRKGTSCPLLYAWSGDGWRFVTDFLGGAAVGYQKARGVFNEPDTDEYVRIDGGIVERDGEVRVRLNNQLEEVIWFDHVALVAVDHPEDAEVYPNERLMPGPPWPAHRLYASADLRPLAAARGVESGQDLRAALAERDRRYADDFALLAWKGYAEGHTLEFDLGDFPPGERVVLLLDGWIDYADSSANIAAEQAGARLVPPVLEVADGRGGWRATGDRMGFPAGLPKTMAVELTGLFPSADHRVRIATSMRLYWDRARVMIGGAALPLVERRIAPASAELRFGGFPAPASPDGRKPHAYDPAGPVAHGGFKAHAGAYTGFGDVRELLFAVDDRFVTTRSGDEIELRFPAPPPPAQGFSRTWLLYADGFGKDMDPNSAAADEVGPIPFHGMPVYPYPAEVVPPPAASSASRRVLPAPDGLPGALPQPLVPRSGS